MVDEYDGPGSERLIEIADELKELKLEILDKLMEARSLIAEAGLHGTLEQADSYWIPHVTMALTSDHGYLGGSMFTMENAIEAVDEAREEAIDIEAERRDAAVARWVEATAAGDVPSERDAQVVEELPKRLRTDAFLDAVTVMAGGSDEAFEEARLRVDSLHRKALGEAPIDAEDETDRRTRGRSV